MPTQNHMHHHYPPNDHPEIKPARIGVLLMNLGTPEGTDYLSLRRYLGEFLSDKRVIDYPSWLWQPLLQGVILTSRPLRSGAAYRKIWNKERNESPLKTYTRSQCEKIRAAFQKDHPEIIFEWGMRYGHPSVESGIRNLQDQGARKILLFALYPQYSAATTASAYDKAFDVLKDLRFQPAVRTAPPWHDDPGYIEALANSVRTKLAGLEGSNQEKPQKKPEHLIMSFHGLPKRYLMAGDPYHCMCRKTSRLVREALAWPEDHWHTTFQSRFGPEKWLEPYTDKTIEDLARRGVKSLAIISPAFVSECIETLEEIQILGAESFHENGGEDLIYIPCLNDSDAHIDLLASYIKKELAGWI